MKIESINFIQRIFNQGIKLDDNSLATKVHHNYVPQSPFWRNEDFCVNFSISFTLIIHENSTLSCSNFNARSILLYFINVIFNPPFKHLLETNQRKRQKKVKNSSHSQFSILRPKSFPGSYSTSATERANYPKRQ